MKNTIEKQADVKNGVSRMVFADHSARSKVVTDYYANGRGAFMRFGQLLLRLAAPLM